MSDLPCKIVFRSLGIHDFPAAEGGRKIWGFLGPVRTEPPLGVGGSDPGFIRLR